MFLFRIINHLLREEERDRPPSLMSSPLVQSHSMPIGQ